MNRSKLKICGITRKDQGVAIAELGVDALGFILYPKSPRYISPERIREIIQALPPFTKTVGVFVNEPVPELVSIVGKSGLDLVQLSGEESPEYCSTLSGKGINWIKGFRVKDSYDLEKLQPFKLGYFLMDAWSADEYGGTGQVFDWSLLDQVTDRSKIVLAGGINSDNVSIAIQKIKPYAIDVSSGVEIKPGFKSIEKVRSLVLAVQATAF